ncbi:MAG: MFS transporter [Acidimicrobiia bacterium]|nr:MFS transporter [Acidimicrobiia bacterium]
MRSRTNRPDPDGRGAAPYGWSPMLVLAAVNLVDGAEKSLVAGALPLLQDEWGFSDTWGGAIPAADAAISAVVLLPAGYLADRVTRTRLLAIVVLSWAVLSTASAAAVSFAMFFAVRFVLGAANALDNPPASSLLADFYPSRSRGRAFGTQRIALALGTAIGLAVGGGVGELLGWRAPFLVMALPGLAVALLCARLVEPPRGGLDRAHHEAGPYRPPGEETPTEATGDGPSGSGGTPLPGAAGPRGQLRLVRTLLSIPTVRSLYLGLTLTLLGLQGVVFWLPSFLERTHDLTEGRAAALTGAVFLLTSLPGSLVGGALGDRAGLGRPGGRIVVVAASVAAGAGLLIAGLVVPVLAPQLLLVAAAVFVLSFSVPNYAAATADVIPAPVRGTGFSVFTLLVSVGGALGPLLVGLVSDLGSLRLALVVAVLPALVGSPVVLRAAATHDADVASARAAVAPTLAPRRDRG